MPPLLLGRVYLANKNLLAGTLPASKKLFAGTLPEIKRLFAGTPNELFSLFSLCCQSQTGLINPLLSLLRTNVRNVMAPSDYTVELN